MFLVAGPATQGEPPFVITTLFLTSQDQRDCGSPRKKVPLTRKLKSAMMRTSLSFRKFAPTVFGIARIKSTGSCVRRGKGVQHRSYKRRGDTQRNKRVGRIVTSKVGTYHIDWICVVQQGGNQHSASLAKFVDFAAVGDQALPEEKVVMLLAEAHRLHTPDIEVLA